MTTLGFLGFGEAGSTLTAGVRAAGVSGVVAYDTAWLTSDLVGARAAETETELLPSPERLAARADVIVSAVIGTQAYEAAVSVEPYLQERHAFVDINSVSPGVKRLIAPRIESRGASYFDVAVMSNVTSDLARLPLLVAARSGRPLPDVLSRAGLSAEQVSSEPGDAAQIKMFRSLLVKGMEALALEALLASFQTGMHERVIASLDAAFGHLTTGDLMRHLVERHAVHGARRATELQEVATALREVGVEPLMADAGYERMSWDVHRGLQGSFDAAHDPDWIDILAELERLRAAEPPA